MATSNGDVTPVVLVTGATGYLASCLVKQLAEAGDYKLRCTVRSLENNQKLEALKQVLKDCKTQPEFVQADLLQSADQWKWAVAGCDYVLHTASPFPFEEPSNPDLVIKPAVEGTMSVLKACADAGTVKRAVITSSCAAIYELGPERMYTENDWPDVSKLPNAYFKSKPLAEKAAWDYVNGLPDERRFELVVLNPGFITGPPAISMTSSSIEIVRKILTREWSMVPPMSFPVVDLGDVVQAHITALTCPEAAGHRHILAEKTYRMKDIAVILADEFNSKGFNVSRKEIPACLLIVMSVFSSMARTMRRGMASFPIMDNTRMKLVLRIEPRPARQSLVEMGHALIELGIVPNPKDR